MEAHRVERKLAAILHADVKGYSRLIAEDEVATLRVLGAYLERMNALVQHHGGRAVGSRGDSLLAEFPSVVEAVQCAVEIQHELTVRNRELPVTRRVEFRIGINLGEIVVEGDQIHGDGINIAVRLEGLAEAGGIFISDVVHEQVKNRLPLHYQYVGERTLKNIATPVRVWVVTEAHPAESKGKSQLRRALAGHWSRTVLLGLLVAGGVATILYFSLPFRTPQSIIRNPAAQPPSLPLPDKPSLVVLPFVNMSKDPEQEYFNDGLTEVLTSALSRLSGLFVIARNSAFTYKGKAAKVQDVGREMGVRYVLEGSVQRADQRVRIAAQLIEAKSGYHLWSEEYDRPLKDILALQDEIVQKIVTTLKLQLTLQEQGYMIVRKHTDNVEAFDYYLRGVGSVLLFTKEANDRARQMYDKALVLDPQYAEAYASLAGTYYLDWIWRWSADPRTLERAFALAQKAIALDDSLPSAHTVLSLVYAQKQQYDQAITEGERAIALDPNNAESYAMQSEVLYFAGRPEGALDTAQQAIRLNPRHPPVYLDELASAYLFNGRYAEAIATEKEVISRSPTHLGAYFTLTSSYLSQWISQEDPDGQTLEKALAAAQRTVALNESSAPCHTLVGSVYLCQKQYDQAISSAERAIALDPNDAWGYAVLAEALGCVGRSEEAVAAADRALHLTPLVADIHLVSVGDAYALAGRFDEAIPPLRQYLRRYPKFLLPHLVLARVYSELGKAAEARAEAAEVLQLNPTFSLAVYRQRAPIKDPAVLERALAALRMAGLK